MGDASGAGVPLGERRLEYRAAVLDCASMIGILKSAPAVERLSRHEIDPEYRRLRTQVFVGIFLGYAAYYLVRNTLALAIPDIIKERHL